MKRQMLSAALAPAVVLVATMIAGLVCENSGRIPVGLDFSTPLVKSLEANGLRVDGVVHASHYEPRMGRAASIQTNLGSVTLIQFENPTDAQAQLGEAKKWCCAHFLFTLTDRAVIFTDQPELDRLIKRGS